MKSVNRVRALFRFSTLWLLLLGLFFTASCVGRSPAPASGPPQVSGELQLKSPPRPKMPQGQ